MSPCGYFVLSEDTRGTILLRNGGDVYYPKPNWMSLQDFIKLYIKKKPELSEIRNELGQ